MKNDLSGYIKENVHYFPVRVYYSDTDAGGIIYHSRYLDMAEHGRTEMLRSFGGHQKEILEKNKMAFVVKSININYIKPGVLDDLLVVETTVTKCERFTILFFQKIFKGKELLTTLDVKVGSISLESGRPTAMTDDIKKELVTVLE